MWFYRCKGSIDNYILGVCVIQSEVWVKENSVDF